MNFLMFILGLLPIAWLAFALLVLKLPTYKAAFGSLIIALVLSISIWHLPIIESISAALEGSVMAMWPIIFVIIAAVFTYNLSCETKGMDVIKQMIASISNDKRLMVLLIAWCFGGFMEGIAGFGTAIAIPSGMLTSLGFGPLFSVLVCLIANGTPTPFGSIGIPTVTLANLVGLDNAPLAFMTTLQLAPFMLACPFIIVMLTGKNIKSIKGISFITLAAGLSFVIPQLIVAYFIGAELAVVVGSVCSLICTALLAKHKDADEAYIMDMDTSQKITLKEALIAWSPFILIFFFLLLTSKLVQPVNEALAKYASQFIIYRGKDPNVLTLNWINTPGVWIILSGIIGGLIQKCSFSTMLKVFKNTVVQMVETMGTMIFVLAAAKVMSYGGMIESVSSFAIGATGSLYPLIAPWIGALGTFVTGSGTNSGVLFGEVQMDAARQLHTNPYWTVALNSLGVAAGKMMSPQSLAIGLSTVDAKGDDAKLLRMIAPYGIAFLILMSVISVVGTTFFAQ